MRPIIQENFNKNPATHNSLFMFASYETYHLQRSHLILRYRALSTVKRPSRNSRQIAILVHEAVQYCARFPW